MTAFLGPYPKFQGFYPGTNLPVVGGKLWSYQAGTSTPQATYSDASGSTPNANPVVLNAYGQADVWYGYGLNYKLTLTDALGNVLWTVDNYKSDTSANIYTDLASTATAKGDSLIGVLASQTGAVATTQHEVNTRRVNIFDFLTALQQADVKAGTKAYDLTAAFALAFAAANTTVECPAGVYKANIVMTLPGQRLVGAGKYATRIISASIASPAVLLNSTAQQITWAGVSDLSIESSTAGSGTGLQLSAHGVYIVA